MDSADRYMYEQEEKAHTLFTQAVAAGDIPLIRELCASSCGDGFGFYDAHCQLSMACRHAHLRETGLVEVLLASGHPPDGIHERHSDICPIVSLFEDVDAEDVACLSMLLNRGAQVDHWVTPRSYDNDACAFDERHSVWSIVLRTGKQGYVQAMLDQGWNPEAWRSWKTSKDSPHDPLQALDVFVRHGSFHGVGQRNQAEARAVTAARLLDLLVDHGFNIHAPDVVAPQSAWWAKWQRTTMEKASGTPTPAARPGPRL